jgi:hypothetical protein
MGMEFQAKRRETGYNGGDMSAIPKSSVVTEGAIRTIHPLDNGDRLKRAEFERRYHAMPQVKKAELIEGLVFMPSPVRTTQHGRPHGVLCAWLGHYVFFTPGIETGFSDNGTVRLDDDNEPQPDLMLLLPKGVGGVGVIDEEGYVSGPPGLVCEVAASSVSIDAHAKFNVYLRHGVREYLVWRVLDEAVDWFILRGDQYAPLARDERGIIRSEQFPGLWLDMAALLKMDGVGLLKTLDEGIASAEHAAFVERLRRG